MQQTQFYEESEIRNIELQNTGNFLDQSFSGVVNTESVSMEHM